MPTVGYDAPIRREHSSSVSVNQLHYPSTTVMSTLNESTHRTHQVQVQHQHSLISILNPQHNKPLDSTEEATPTGRNDGHHSSIADRNSLRTEHISQDIIVNQDHISGCATMDEKVPMDDLLELRIVEARHGPDTIQRQNSKVQTTKLSNRPPLTRQRSAGSEYTFKNEVEPTAASVDTNSNHYNYTNENNNNKYIYTDNETVEGLKILIVDDSAVTRRMLARIVRWRCSVCDEAADGAEAVRCVRNRITKQERSYDIILMDSVLPIMDGRQACLAIRRLGYSGE